MKPTFTLTSAAPLKNWDGGFYDDKIHIATAHVLQIRTNHIGQTFVDLGNSAAVVAETPEQAAAAYAEACNG